jgi:hypothetical protein
MRRLSNAPESFVPRRDSEDPCLTLIGFRQAHQDLNRCRFSGAIPPQETKDAASGNSQIQTASASCPLNDFRSATASIAHSVMFFS